MSYSDAIAEAYASAPVDQVILDTLELYHPSFTDEIGRPTAIYVVLGYQNFTLRLDPGAIINPGDYVEFLGCSFEVTLPEFSEEGAPSMNLSIGNVSREITRHLEQARQSIVPITVTYRPYLVSDPTQPQLDPPIVMELADVDVDVFTASGTCKLKDVNNTAFPKEKYTSTRFPGLRR